MNTRVKTALERMAAQRFPSEELQGGGPPLPVSAFHRERVTGTSAQPSPRKVLRSPTRRRVLLAGGVAIVAGIVVAGIQPLGLPFTGDAAYAETPPLLMFTPAAGNQTAKGVLTDLAAQARAQPAPSGTGAYHYVHTRGWYLYASANIEDNKVFDSGVAAVDREQWVAADGSGRLDRKYSEGPTMEPSRVFRPGEFGMGLVSGNESTEALRTRLARGNTPAEWVEAVSRLWRQQVVPPALHSKLLEILADQPGLTLRGATTDRAGRNGIAISVEDTRDDDQRVILVFDPRTGAILDVETILLEAGDLPIKVPATGSYTVWLSAGYTPTTQQRP